MLLVETIASSISRSIFHILFVELMKKKLPYRKQKCEKRNNSGLFRSKFLFFSQDIYISQIKMQLNNEI